VNGVIVGADDLGLSPGVTQGILEAHRDGVVRSTSLLVTFPAGQEAANLARNEPGLEVGLHLDLVGGHPCSDPSDVPSLVDSEGRFHRLPQFTARLLSGRIRLAELATEVRAQAARAREWGIEPLAWDSHRHTHLIPQASRVIAVVARQEGVRYLRRARPPRVAATAKAQLLGAASIPRAIAAFPSFASVVDTGYGRAVLVKTGVLACVLGLAWLNRRRLQRLGFVAELLSRPVLVGYLAGVAIIMAFGQLGKVAGAQVPEMSWRGAGPGTVCANTTEERVNPAHSTRISTPKRLSISKLVPPVFTFETDGKVRWDLLPRLHRFPRSRTIGYPPTSGIL